jgi:hypothetical protein
MKTLLIALTLTFTSCLLSGFKSISKNSFKIGDKEWSLTSFILANESYGVASKWEVDLMSDNVDITKAKTFIYFSITGNRTTKLSDGIYEFASTNLSERSPFHFDGSIKVNSKEIKITGGSFSVENDKESTEIHFILRLENGDSVTGNYSGKVSAINRSTNYQ